MWFYKIEKEGKDIHVTWNTTMTYLKNTWLNRYIGDLLI